MLLAAPPVTTTLKCDSVPMSVESGRMESTKLSFSLASKSTSKQNPKRPSAADSTHSKHEFVTEFDPSKTLTHEKPSAFAIPRLENTWNPHKKMKNLDVPFRSASDDPDLRFEVEAPATADAADSSSMSYGLNIRAKDEPNPTKKKNDDDDAQQNHLFETTARATDNLMLEKFKEDMKNLPEDRGMDEFVDMPVEGFGAALLKAYGWSEGKGIGKRAKEDVKVVQYVRRANLEGLGFVPDANYTDKKGRKSGQDQLVAPKGTDGKTRHVVGIDEKLVPRELKGVHVGKIVRVVGGRHFGMKGRVLEKFDSGVVVLKLGNDEKVTVGIKEVAELGSVDDEICFKELKSRGSKDHKKASDRTESSSCREREEENRKQGRDDRNKYKRQCVDEGINVKDEKYGRREHVSKKPEKSTPVSWLTSHIRVRIISKDFKGGRLYLKKGEVVDVVGPNTCDISLDESKQLIQGVNQDILETAVPKRGGPVLILYGKHKGVYGHLMERNMEKETGIVQDADSHELLNVHLEQIAEYIGDPSCIGY